MISDCLYFLQINCKFLKTILKPWYLYQMIISRIIFRSIGNIEEHISAEERIVLQNLKTIETKKTTKQNTIFRGSFSQLFFRLLQPYCNSLVWLAVLFIEIVPKNIWNCIIGFFDPLTWKHVTHVMCSNAMAIWLEC